MENKYSSFSINNRVNLYFCVAHCVGGRMFMKLPNGFQSKKELDAIEKFKMQHKAKGETVVVEYITIYDENVYGAFLNIFWSQLTTKEKEAVLYAACKKYTGQEFVYTQNFNDTNKDRNNHPFYVDEKGFYLNSQVLNSTTHPAEILSMLFCLPFEQRRYIYHQNPAPKNILGFQTFEELCCNKYVENAFKKSLKQYTGKKLEQAECDSVSARAYRDARAEAFDELVEAALTFNYLPAKDLHYLDEKVEAMLGIEECIDITLGSNADDRDMELIKKANDHFNRIAKKEGRTDDIVEDAKAFEHFGFNFTIDFSCEDEDQDQTEEDSFNDAPIYDA